MKPVASTRKSVLISSALSIVVLFGTIFSGCGTTTNKTNTEYADEYLNYAYQDFFDVDYSEALKDVDVSIAYAPTNGALSLKAQLQYLTGEYAAANDTLVTFEALFPNDGAKDFLRAYFLSLKATDGGDQILSHLQAALAHDYAGLGYESFWAMVEEFDSLKYFRNNFQAQYASLEAMKTPEPDIEGAGVTRFVKAHGIIGPALYISHEDMWMLKAVRDLEALIARVAIPKPYGSLVSQAIKIRTTFIQQKDNKNCGVKLQWTILTWIADPKLIELFWASSQ